MSYVHQKSILIACLTATLFISACNPVPPAPSTTPITPNPASPTVTATGGCKVNNVENQSCKLTPGTDALTGTSGADTIDGSRMLNASVLSDSFNSTDCINGAEGTDTLAATLTGSVTVTPNCFKGIEIFNVTAQSAVTVDFAAADTSLTTIRQVGGTAPVVVQNVPSFVSNVGVTDTSLSSSVLYLTIANTQLGGASDTTTLTYSGVTKGDVTLAPVTVGSGFEAINVVSTGSTANGSNTRLMLDDGLGNSLTTVNVSGAQNLKIGLTPTTVTTVNASTFTGALDITLAPSNGQTVTVTGGSGNDTINVGATAGDYSSSDTINCGAGTADRVNMPSADVSAATVNQTNMTNCEIIGVNGAAIRWSQSDI